MAWLSDKTSNEKSSDEKDKRYVQIKPRVEGEIWDIFKGVAQMNNIPLKNALSEALKLWVSEFSITSYECKYCGNYIKYNYIAKFMNGKVEYYCSVRCCNMCQ